MNKGETEAPAWAQDLLIAALEEFGSEDVRLLWVDASVVRGDSDSDGICGRTDRNSVGSGWKFDVYIDRDRDLQQQRRTLLHEIAHVFTPGEGHDWPWAAAFAELLDWASS